MSLQKDNVLSGHMAFIQGRINVDATYDVASTLIRPCINLRHIAFVECRS